MNRAEAAKAIAKKHAKATEAKVRGAVAILQFLQEKITVTSVAKRGAVSRDTARKYLKEMGLIL
jgi:response regulator of citrate/malate metabolism